MISTVSILGSTGSIGTQALEVIDRYPQIKVMALSAGRNIELLEKQTRKYKPELVCLEREEDANVLKDMLADTPVKVVFGMEGLCRVAAYEKSQMTLTAVVGMVGIEPTIAAIKAKKDIALANKETLVCAGHIIMPLAKEMGVKILPVDSEHSAIFQSLQGRADNKIKKIILTASGGPFRTKTIDELKNIKPEDALAHPNWDMGAKITIDSSTMINKGLEVMEAMHLFDVPVEKIEVVVHKESILHSAVEFEDGAIIGQMGTPDMRLPISYALFYPDRKELGGKGLSLTEIGSLTFEKPRLDTFKGLALCLEAAKMGGNRPTILNAANEVAVAAFLKREISYLEIIDFIDEKLREEEFVENPTLEELVSLGHRIMAGK